MQDSESYTLHCCFLIINVRIAYSLGEISLGSEVWPEY